MQHELLTEIFSQRIRVTRIGRRCLRGGINIRQTITGGGCDVDEALYTLSPRGLKHDKGAIDIGAKISLWLLDRRNDVRACCEVEDPFSPGAGGRNGCAVSNISLDDFQKRVALVLLQIR